ncbi:hypothetical protein [Nannocystis punicea]|uniref:Uncharacterized protein n=1 Tax=Nannocystis punicea TaxID=2995304 RepID=A0ABY7GYV8_9BACT|nr:hypothetical protein [Nannocystis poenicansa]WAS92118.1 hypothetical protein O0S08_38540 [Nannocystis poenicansa]
MIPVPLHDSARLHPAGAAARHLGSSAMILFDLTPPPACALQERPRDTSEAPR